MNSSQTAQKIIELVKYDPKRSCLVWRERDESSYSNAPDEKTAKQRARSFNKIYAGKELSIRRNNSGARYLWVRIDNHKVSIGADKLLWLCIAGEFPEDGALYFKDKNVDNMALDNLLLAHPLTRQVLENPTTGLSKYQRGEEEFYRATIYKNKSVDRTIKSGFTSAKEAYDWRVKHLSDNDAWWVIEAVDAYENNPNR